MVSLHSKMNYTGILPGIRIKTLLVGEKTLMTKILLSKDALLPDHSHPSEQTGYLISGSMTLYIAGEKHVVTSGDSWMIPAHVPHRAEILENSVALEIFSPPRDDYRKYLDSDALVGLE